MKTQSWILAASLALPFGCAFAQTNPAQPSSAEAQQEIIIKRAEALTEEQINQTHDMAALSKLAQIYGAKSDTQRLTWVLHRATELLPNSGDLKLQLAMAYAKADDKTHAYDTLMRMQVQGFGYDLADDPRFEKIHGTRVWDYIVANLQVNAKPFGEGSVAFQLPKTDVLMNALAWDPKRKQLLIGSARDGSIHLADENGKLNDFIAAGAGGNIWGVDALGVDSAHNKFYVATSASPKYKGFSGDNADKAAIAEFELSSGKFVQKYTLPQEGGGPRTFDAIAVAKDGQVYVADATHKTVLKIEGQRLKPILQNPKLTTISGLAVSDDARTLYLADYSLGIFGFDLTKGTAFDLKHNPAQLVLGGIVGMHWYDGTLLVIEDGMVPKRVMRLQLSKDGQSIDHAMPLDVASPAFAKLGDGTVAGEKLYFVANRQDDLYDSHGVLTAADKVVGEKIYRSDARFAWGQTGVNLKGEASLQEAPDAKKPAATKPDKH